MSRRQQGWDAGEWDKQDIVGWQGGFPPLWGIYYACCNERYHVVVVECVCFFINNIVVDLFLPSQYSAYAVLVFSLKNIIPSTRFEVR